jgi:hypothetical protein
MATERASHRAFFGVSALLFAASTAITIVWCASMSAMEGMSMPGGWDDVDGVDADARTDVARRRGVVPRHVDRDDGGDDAAVPGPDAVGATARPSAGQARRASVG